MNSETNDDHPRHAASRGEADLASPPPPAHREVTPSAPTGLAVFDAVLEEAVGRGLRRDPVVAGTGGPAGNARLTSWIGLLLLVLIAGELITLLDVFGLMNWHVGIGIGLTALALLKTASTGWRILRYYTESTTYGSAGPPPLLLRLLGPLVIAATLGVLGSGLALIAVGPARSRQPWITVVGHPLSLVTLHAGFFVLFAVLTGLHLLARFIPALSLATGRPRRPGAAELAVPGEGRRIALIAATCVAAVLAIVLVLPSVHGWQRERHFHHDEAPSTVGAHA